MEVHWDRRNGFDSYPYPHNDVWGWQECPTCGSVVRGMEKACDYYESIETCKKCGTKVRCPAVVDDGRFARAYTTSFVRRKGHGPLFLAKSQ